MLTDFGATDLASCVGGNVVVEKAADVAVTKGWRRSLKVELATSPLSGATKVEPKATIDSKKLGIIEFRIDLKCYFKCYNYKPAKIIYSLNRLNRSSPPKK